MTGFTLQARLTWASVALFSILAAACGNPSADDDVSTNAREPDAVETNSPDDTDIPDEAGTTEESASTAEVDDDQAPGFDPSAPADDEEATDVTWLDYEDPDLLYRISYPPDLAPAPTDAASLSIPALTAIDFRDPSMIDQGPAFMSIRVYENGSEISLDDWIEELTPAGGSRQRRDIVVAGVGAVETCSSTFIAPGCDLFLTSTGHLYHLVPFGEYGDQMLGSFELPAS